MKKLLLLSLISLTVNSFGQNNTPIAIHDTLYINFNDSAILNSPGSANLYLNDSDLDNDNLFIDTAIYNGQGSFIFKTLITSSTTSFIRIVYKPPFNFVGIDSAIYILKDNGIPVKYDTATIYFYVKHQEFEFLDLNNINARLGLYSLFQDQANSIGGFEAPKGDTTSTIFAANLWLSGKNLDSAYANCETFGNLMASYNSFTSFYSRTGPIMDSIYYPKHPKSYDYKWDRLWKINAWDIDDHINNWNTTGYQAIEVIENWPAHGDITKGQAYYLAPFIDNNNDGFYNPYDGDYPKIKGQQAIYNIYNDIRWQANTDKPMKSEVHYMAYAYNCPSDSAINNTIFLDYTIYNRSNLTYDSTYVGFWADFDIGGSTDDFVGCDVNRSTFYAMNGDNADEGGNGVKGFGNYPPAQGVTFLKGAKQDDDGIANNFGINNNETINGLGFSDAIIDNEYWGMEHFMSYNIGNGQHIGDGDPTIHSQYYNYLKGFWRDNTQMVYGGNGHIGGGGTIPAKYIYPNNSDSYLYGTYGITPSPSNWSETSNVNFPGDRRGLGSTGPFTFQPGEKIELTLAFVFGRDYQNTGAQAGVVVMQERVDSIRSYYLNDFTNTACGLALSIDKNELEDNILTIYPNPFNNQITINYELKNSQAQLKVFNGVGKLVKEVVLKNNQTTIDLSQQANGIYFIQLTDGKNRLTKKVVKQ